MKKNNSQTRWYGGNVILARLTRKGQERLHVLVVRKTRLKWRNKRTVVQFYSSREKISRQRRKPTTNSTRIWHCYLCLSSSSLSLYRIQWRFCLRRGGWLVNTPNEITFHPNLGTLKETSVFCGTFPPPPQPSKNLFLFFTCIHNFFNRLITSFPSKRNCVAINSNSIWRYLLWARWREILE